jgi:hypothetical protein
LGFNENPIHKFKVTIIGKMMIKRILQITLLLVILLFQNQLQAQEFGGYLTTEQATETASTEYNSDEKSSLYIPKNGLRFEFLGSLIFPGFKIGLEKPFSYTQIEKFRRNKIKRLYKERYLSYSMGMYYQDNYHTNIFPQAELIARRQKNKGFYYERSLGLGFSRTFVNSPTFSVSDDGKIVEQPLSGNWYGLASIGGGIGYNAYLKNQRPYSVYLKLHLMVMYPYNTFITPRPTIGIGYNYNFSGLGEASPRLKYKVKRR